MTTRFGKIGGAYVATVALADSEESFMAVVSEYMRELRLVVVEAEDVEPMATRLQAGSPEPDLVRLAHALSASAPVAMNVFDTYPLEDGN